MPAFSLLTERREDGEETQVSAHASWCLSYFPQDTTILPAGLGPDERGCWQPSCQGSTAHAGRWVGRGAGGWLPLPLESGFLSGLSPFITQMLSMTSLTGPGGFCIDFTSEMSAGFRVSSAASAASRAGIASARSPSHSFCRWHRDRRG